MTDPDVLALASEFNAAMDELNAALAVAETALTDLHLGVSASVFIREGLFLTFKRTSTGWHLCIDHDDAMSQMLLNCSRETRLRAVEKLPELYDELIKTAKIQIDEVREKTLQVDAFVAAIAKGE
jgi:hypothetical protein